ncbi:histone acetyltransferase KAT6B-like isoform X2 [Amphiura filiformis]|uniref:histone acetyltransferase KAT6B-like isoform X2 n=1 Tax=Amphiura filiformis TaxID=82378 RepID=UPI003B2136B4
MAEKTIEEKILECIDSLRRRKARPDLERISHMVERKYGVSSAQVERELERLVEIENSSVIKVEYKGSTSYRNAAKWRKSHLSGNILNSSEISNALINAVEALWTDVPNTSSDNATGEPPTRGVSIGDIEKLVLDQNPDTKLTEEGRLVQALNREVEAGRISRTQAGNYAPVKTGPTLEIPKKSTKPKRKRIKKTHGPDFEEPLAKMPNLSQKCDYCSLPASNNTFGDVEDLLICKDCNLKVHPSCMKYSPELAERTRLSPWQCMHCKTCRICDDSGDADTLLFCDACDKGYHMACHNPSVRSKPLGKWVCHACEVDAELDAIYGSSDLSTNGDELPVSDLDSFPSHEGSPSPMLQQGKSAKGSRTTSPGSQGKITPEVATPNQSRSANLPEQSAANATNGKLHGITDPGSWTIQDVVGYFTRCGFAEHATVFEEQEIDGKSLLLLKRLDVLTGLSLKLGPALKMYNHVMELQLHSEPTSPPQ